MTPKEHGHRIAFAERQWECWRLRVVQAQLEASIHLARGDIDKAARRTDAAKNWVEHLNTCNETIDQHRRALDPSDEDRNEALEAEIERCASPTGGTGR